MEKREIRVLLIEDNPGDARLIQEMLAEAREVRFSMSHSDRLSAGLDRLDEAPYDVVLLDLGLPDSRGLDALPTLRSRMPKLPVVVLTGIEDEELALHAVQQGAQDYLQKGQLDSNLLARSLRYAIERKRTTDALEESEERYRELVEHANSIILKVDSQGRIIFFNEFAQMFYGYAAEEVIGRSIVGTLFPERDSSGADLSETARDMLRSPGQYARYENETVRKNGERVWVAWAIRAISDREGGENGFLAVGQDVTERRRMMETIRQQAYYDALTGLPNRMLFLDHLTLALHHAQRVGESLAVLFLDLDQFKLINDTMGHTMGDAILKTVAELLRSCVRAPDTVARIGGDEYTILLTRIARAGDAAKVAGKIISLFKHPLVVEGHEFHLSVSIGISLCPGDGEDVETLLKKADTALYHVKEHGRNNYQFYNTAMNAQTLERIVREKNLRRAIEEGELEVYYQPLADMENRRIHCAEALVRWNHPELGLLSPPQFLPFAEETGLVVSLDEWVLRTACTQNKQWQDRGYPPLCITTNLSTRLFQQQSLVNFVGRTLRDTGLEPQFLGFEISETTAMRDVEHTLLHLDRLTEMGVELSIDDFGTGYSSLSHLKRFPLRKLKIDRSFIKDLARDPDDRSIIKTVIDMGHNLKLVVTAEGVETEEQLAFLQAVGCDEVQGFLISPPLPAREFSEFVAAQD